MPIRPPRLGTSDGARHPKGRADTRPSASRRGYGTDWRKLRAKTLKAPCAACGAPWEPGFHLDHIIPRRAGGSDSRPKHAHYRDTLLAIIKEIEKMAIAGGTATARTGALESWTG